MGSKARRKKEQGTRGAKQEEPGRLLAGWQRTLAWALWLGWLALAFANSANVSMGWKEGLLFVVALSFTFFCWRMPLGPRKVFIREPAEVRGSFESRTNWAFVLIGALLSLGGFAAIVKMIADLKSGRTTVGGIFNDMGVFLVEWFHERISGGVHDGELEKTQGYILFVLLIPGLFILLFCLIPWLNRGVAWSVDSHDVLKRWRDGQWEIVNDFDYAVVEADSVTIEYKSSAEAPPGVVLPQDRVFSRELNTRVDDKVLGRYFSERLEKKGFALESRSENGTSWIAKRTEKSTGTA